MDNKLSKTAYGGVAGKDYRPYVSGSSRSGLCLPVLISGMILAALFAASTAYSGMKSGLTVAAGIPGSIIGSAFVAAFAKEKGILGKNLIQGMSSGGESVASGIIYVLPSILLIGCQFSFIEGFIVSIGGAFFGIGIASLIHNNLLIEEHGNLMYPESMAISETLVASEGAGDSIRFMGIGFTISGLITLATESVFNAANNLISLVNESIYKWKFELEVNPLLVGIGFIVGLDVSVTMFAGSILANFAVMPLIGYFAAFGKDGATVWNDPNVALNAMQVKHISGSYVKYIGAGMMLSGGLIGAIRLIPTIVSSIRDTLNAKSSAGSTNSSSANKILLAGVAIGLGSGFLVSGGNVLMAVLASVLSLLLSLLFVIVSGRLTGTIGSSNLPVSGMTIASLVIVTLLFVFMGWRDSDSNRSLLLFGAFIVIAISIAAGYCQSQKVNFIIGGYKHEMDKAFSVATVVGVGVVVGVILLLSSQLAMTGDKVSFALPQANLMATLTDGIMEGQLPWALIVVGVVMGLVLFLLNLSIMTVALGFYLPISTTSIIIVGALIRLFVEKTAKSDTEKELRITNGISLSSGLVAGGSIIGLLGIVFKVLGVLGENAPKGFAATNGMACLLLAILVVAMILSLRGIAGKANQ